MERSDVTLQATGEINEDGIGSVFAANVFGHYIMVCSTQDSLCSRTNSLLQARELESLLDASGDGRVIWTSSITAEKACFNIDDWQGIKR